jgi:DNA topoisomerase-2
VASKLFPEGDSHTLLYLEEEGLRVEPMYFLPVLPMVLVNGAEGIGTGWMTHVPMYNHREIAT